MLEYNIAKVRGQSSVPTYIYMNSTIIYILLTIIY